MVVGRLTSCSPKQVVELLPARLLRTVLLQQQLLLAPDQLVLAAPQHGRPRTLLMVLCRRSYYYNIKHIMMEILNLHLVQAEDDF